MPRPPAPLPPPLARAPFAVATGREHVLTPAQLRRSSLRAPTRGIRAATPAPARTDLHARARDLLPVLPAGAVFSHATALALLGLDLPDASLADGLLHVEVGPGTSRVRRPGVRAHRRSSTEVRSLVLPGPLPVLVPEAAWARLGALLPLDDLVVVGDLLTRRRNPPYTLAGLRDAVAARGRGRGIRTLRDALGLVRPRTDSPMETRLRLLIVRAGLPEPAVNALVRARDGEVVAMPDLSYARERVAVEYDGDVHRTDRRTWRRDIARRQALEHLGWRVVTCTADDVLASPARATTWIRAALARPTASSGQQMRGPQT
ncbi:DUF559 domain-containing protein [Cellulomonas triticagri]|uniref:DUF559 domain-containing protein n=1 Tax=Cellulomonas triticagri TaxID=2483352 RepID=A0A3M2JGA1_9CELL|nr:DUF559 domain-containing protein [Cellulomonas triticagri]RMI12579.1 DUF559 domain-containing protein [Cellulomonas triticagri]